MNRRRLLFLALLLTIGSPASADLRDDFEVGLHVSMGPSQMVSSSSVPAGYRLSGAFGTSATYKVDAKISLEAQLGYALKGNATEDFAIGINTVSLYSRLHYIHFPLVVRYAVSDITPNHKLSFIFGGFGSYLISADQDLNGVTSDIQNNLSKIDHGLIFGVGLAQKSPFNPKHTLTYELKYEFGTRDILDRAKNRYLGLGLRYGL